MNSLILHNEQDGSPLIINLNSLKYFEFGSKNFDDGEHNIFLIEGTKLFIIQETSYEILTQIDKMKGKD